ncbi:MAG: peptide-methionine (R)-S-oxide reductase MsrB [Chloroflexi bacterium]|nr:peptide-methionine (R)-S-oxide reductase MsrB [Chloroflexota bacterium]
MPEKIKKTNEEWKAILTPDQYHVTREGGTERAFSGEYYNLKARGTYKCVNCGQALFSSEQKYDSGSGWPSFWAPIRDENVMTRPDYKLFTRRTEVLCSRCNAHLGHVFEDGPPPTGLRYCMNSVALKFAPSEETDGDDA